MSNPMKTGLSLLLIVLLLSPACKTTSVTDVTGPTAPTPYSDSRVFTGTLSPQGVFFQGFSVTTQATVTVLLASLTKTGTTTTVSLPMQLTVGTLNADGSACTGSTSVTATPSLTSQINQSLISGTYCVQLADTGSLTSNVDFAIRVNQSANTTVVGQAGTETFSSNLYPLGVATRTFAVTQTGSVTVSLSSVSPAAGLGIGVGIPNTNDCVLNTSLITTPGAGADLSATAEVGTFCVRLFDTGQLPGRVLFNVKITHP
jgi:hypothetical protein